MAVAGEGTGEGVGPVGRHVIKGTLFRRRSSRVTFSEEPPVPEEQREPARRPARVAQMLALAHHLQEAIDKGIVTDRASVARSLGFTRARVTQLLDLLMLAPDIQDRVLALEAVDGVEPIGERGLRDVAHSGTWEEQRAQFSTTMRD